MAPSTERSVTVVASDAASCIGRNDGYAARLATAVAQKRGHVQKFAEIDRTEWGYMTQSVKPAELVERLAAEVREGLDEFKILEIAPEPARDARDFRRATVELEISDELFDLFMNGRTGYRAQYYASESTGEAYNASAVQAIAPMLIDSGRYAEGMDAELCERSLRGVHSKLWFSKAITDPVNASSLAELPLAITPKRWFDYWDRLPPPHKGLLAPRSPSVLLLNGTFVRRHDWQSWKNTDLNRSRELHNSGWV
ncbi:MAG: hypothetical protein WDO56_15900 [Gammaproteobacteria bacterium]